MKEIPPGDGRAGVELTTGDGVPVDVAEHLFDVVRTGPPPESAVHANQ
jgi:hypothetical protein